MSTQVVSAVAQLTWATSVDAAGTHRIELIVIWRGTPGWFLGSSRSSSSGGSGRTFHTTQQFGDLALQATFDAETRVAVVQGKTLSLGDANVIFVDHVDAATGPEVVGTARVDPADMPTAGSRPDVVAALRRSPEVLAFVRCDAALTDTKVQAMIELVCTRVTGSSPRLE